VCAKRQQGRPSSRTRGEDNVCSVKLACYNPRVKAPFWGADLGYSIQAQAAGDAEGGIKSGEEELVDS